MRIAFTEKKLHSRKVISGDQAKVLIETELAKHSNGIHSILAEYRCKEAVAAWHETIRAVEEFINLPKFGIADNRVREWLCAVRLDSKFVSNPAPTWLAVNKALSPYIERPVILRFAQVMHYAAALGAAFAEQGLDTRSTSITLDTIGGAVNYFQSRRRHLISLMYTMPYACSGSLILQPYDALAVLIPQIEFSCIAIASFHQQLTLLEIIPDFILESDLIGTNSSHYLDTLDSDFLEPERASVHTMTDLRGNQFIMPTMKALNQKKIFSVAEMHNNVRLIAATYDAFGLNDSDFSVMSLLLYAFTRHCRDDYYIEIRKEKFQSILLSQSSIEPNKLQMLLVNKPSEYAINTNAYQPFIDLGDMVISNINLLSRFMYAFKNVHLNSRRRFQIHAGFIFEDMVKRDLDLMGFTVTKTKRINRKEFDVIAIRGDTIFNIQCKNNWIDLSKISTDRKLFVRYNKSLTGYYERALTKERNREHLLKKRFGMDKVIHYIVSRFPVICANPAVINYNQIDRLRIVD